MGSGCSAHARPDGSAGTAPANELGVIPSADASTSSSDNSAPVVKVKVDPAPAPAHSGLPHDHSHDRASIISAAGISTLHSGLADDGQHGARRASVASGRTSPCASARSTAAPTADEVLAKLHSSSPARHSQDTEVAAIAAFEKNAVAGRVSRRAFLAVIASLYDKKGVVFDDVAVNSWIDVSLKSLGKLHAGDGGYLDRNEFSMFYRCCCAFADAKAKEKDEWMKHRRTASREPAQFERHVFLGGSCDPTTWRTTVAIPRLQSAGIHYYNPQTTDWHPGLIEMEAQAKDACHALLFMIDSQTRSIASMLEAVEYVLRGRVVVVVVENIPDGTSIDNHTVTGRELKDLNRARSFLVDLVSRNGGHSVLCESLDEAINYLIASHTCCVACGQTAGAQPGSLRQSFIARQLTRIASNRGAAVHDLELADFDTNDPAAAADAYHVAQRNGSTIVTASGTGSSSSSANSSPVRCESTRLTSVVAKHERAADAKPPLDPSQASTSEGSNEADEASAVCPVTVALADAKVCSSPADTLNKDVSIDQSSPTADATKSSGLIVAAQVV